MMENEEELAVYLRKEDEDEEDDADAWDDTQLIKAYDKAISKCKQQIAKKLQNELGLTNEEVKETFSDVSLSSNTKKKNKKKKSKKNSIGGAKSQWQVGDPCRAIYSQDGEEYEAVIIDLIDPHWCVVQFIGYKNEEEVLLRELTPSLGKHVIDVQLKMAQAESGVSEVEETNVFVHNDGIVDQVAELKELYKKIYIPEGKKQPQRVPMVDPSTPPPPPVPAFLNSTKQPTWPLFQPPPLPDADLSSLLQSWYNCGYQTGYYQCLQDQQQSSKHH